jgi:hypothetical protein
MTPENVVLLAIGIFGLTLISIIVCKSFNINPFVRENGVVRIIKSVDTDGDICYIVQTHCTICGVFPQWKAIRTTILLDRAEAVYDAHLKRLEYKQSPASVEVIKSSL